jgi:hypothetical protein
MKLGKMLVGTALSLVCATAAEAQAGGPEITVGLGALSYIMGDEEDAFVIGINQQTVRLGLPL